MKMKALLLVLLGLYAASSYQAEAAEVEKIVKKRYVKIDEGKSDGFEKKKKVCFYNDDDKKIGCGRVVKATSSAAYVRVSSKRAKMIKAGMTAKLEDKSSSVASSDQGDSSSSSSSPKGASNLKVGYLLTALTPAKYNALSYEYPYDEQGNALSSNTLWTVEKEVAASTLGFGAELGFGVGASKMTVGARMRVYKSTTVKSNYDANLNNFSETRMSATAVGAWIDYYYYMMNFGRLSLDIGNGLDIDSSNIAFKMEQKQDGSTDAETLYEASSSLLTASLRTNINLNFFLDPVGLQFGTAILVPLSASQSFSADTINDPQTANLDGSSTAEEDLKTQISHGAASVGVEFFMAAYYAF